MFDMISARRPLASVDKNERGYEVELEVPGVEKENIDITCERGLLTVSFKRDGSDRHALQSRVFSLPEGTDVEKVSARLKNGLLVISLPLKEEMRPIKVTVD